jgi:maleylacetate reductase
MRTRDRSSRRIAAVIGEFPFGQREFAWRDGERTILFGAGILRQAVEKLRERGWERYELLTTHRALADAPVELPEGAAAVHHVPAGPVPEVAAELLRAVTVPTLVALGGGRVIDAAKAVAAVRGGRVCAIPTTLSGAEMTTIHRLPAGAQAPHLIRPALVLADPPAMTGQPEAAMRASAMNALAHGADSLYTPFANPVSRMAALSGAKLIASALDSWPGGPAAGGEAGAPPAEPARWLALGSLLSAFALDSALFALHHVVCQSLVRVLETPHAETNAAMLPRTMEAMRDRAPDAIAALADALGTAPDVIAARIDELAGGSRRLTDLGADPARLDQALDTILARPELRFTPDPPERDELRRLIESAL